MPAVGVRARNCLSTRSFNTLIPCHTRQHRTCHLPLPSIGRSPGACSCLAPSGTQGLPKGPRRGTENACPNPVSQPALAVSLPQGSFSLSRASAAMEGGLDQREVSTQDVSNSLTMMEPPARTASCVTVTPISSRDRHRSGAATPPRSLPRPCPGRSGSISYRSFKRLRDFRENCMRRA